MKKTDPVDSGGVPLQFSLTVDNVVFALKDFVLMTLEDRAGYNLLEDQCIRGGMTSSDLTIAWEKDIPAKYVNAEVIGMYTAWNDELKTSVCHLILDV